MEREKTIIQHKFKSMVGSDVMLKNFYLEEKVSPLRKIMLNEFLVEI